MQGLSTSAHTNWDVVMTPHIVLQETALKLQEFCLLLQPCRLSAEHLVCVGSIAPHICLERCVSVQEGSERQRELGCSKC